MSEAGIPQETGTVPTGQVTSEEIREALGRVLESQDFRASRRCQEFLRFVVDTTLSGNGQTLKERTIGVEVFGRAASYDPGNDSTVRVKAGEVRKRLQTYYSGTGAADPIRIHLPAGGYLPEFHRTPHAPGLTAPPVLGHGALRWPWLLLAACAVSALSIGLYILVGKISPQADPVLLQFWGPALNSTNPVLLCVSYTPVYGLDPALEGANAPPRSPGITDYGRPTKWVLPPKLADRHADEDYALVCRLFHPDTGTPLILLAGITQHGTEAAADLVTSPAQIRAAVRGLPADWPKKSLQLVLHTRVIAGETAAPQVVASYTW